MNANSLSRREFINRSAGTAAALAVGYAAQAATTSAPASRGKYVIGMMGLGIRGPWLLREELTKRPEVEIAYLCDVDAVRLQAAGKLVEEATGRKPKLVDDFRRILDDKNVHALFNTTPDHWHAFPTILACQAGKDVYVEKPASHNPWEGRKMVEAARKYNRVVQVGSQTRSGPYVQRAIEFIRSGQLGDIHFVRVLNMKHRESIGHKPDEPVPEGVNYDRWLGPAPQRPFNRNRFHYTWHWVWDYSGGDIINDGVHQIDLARWVSGKDYPKAVSATGGQFGFDDDQETPDTQVVTWDFDDMTMVFELTLWTPYMEKTEWNFRDTDQFPDWRFNAMRVELYGTKGLMMLGRQGAGWQVFGPGGQEIAAGPGRHPHGPHLDNFFACMESRARPSADIEEGHRSTLLCQIGNIAYRLGRKLTFDAKTESFVNDEGANGYLKRQGRAPWTISDVV
ncbi:MAG: Gfo/Idh/MocA family oxidoreductase [Phycisphaerae bacterium]|nr:Gfo/Idh/MocA family oxidoreductase [Phycisphaerae bacterium]